ncbi:MAG: aquaporin [Mycoplasmataceae bacterium]|nr:aquaporin [Mycoplasmataceae bacterium]
MGDWFNKWHEIGEMMGSFVLTFAALLAIFLVKSKKYGIDTNLKKRMFLALSISSAVVLGVVTAIGFGGHGQINPAVTLMVAGMEGEYQEVPAAIGFQLIGATAAALMVVLTVNLWGQKEILVESFNYNKQTPAKSAGIEFVGNILWLLPIAGMLAFMVKYNHMGAIPKIRDESLDFHTFGHFQLAISAFFAKFLLISIFEEFGAANFNSQVVFGKWVVTAIAHKGKITRRQFFSEGAAVTTTLAIGAALGPLADILAHR